MRGESGGGLGVRDFERLHRGRHFGIRIARWRRLLDTPSPMIDAMKSAATKIETH